jgi:diguanylate cyclase (GGDEF)-like protein
VKTIKPPSSTIEQTEDQTVISPIEMLHETAPHRTPTLLMISGPQLGRSFAIDKDEFMIGRVEHCDLVVEDDLVSRHHCKILATPDGAQIIDLASTNGTLLNGRRVEKAILQEGDQIQVGAITIFKYGMQGEAEAKFLAQLYTSATKDFLTNTYNKKFFMERLQTEFHYTLRHGGPLSLLVMDIDHFKRVNDTYGHVTGDHVIQALAQHLTKHTRRDDLVARFGGEEFVVLMRDCDSDQAQILAEHLRQGIEKIVVSHGGHNLQFTVSVGVATLSSQNQKGMARPEDLVQKADEKLYEAKNSGRNRVSS